MAVVQVILPAVLAVLWASSTQQILVVESLSTDLGNTAPGDAHDTRTGASRSLVSVASKTPNISHSHVHTRKKRQTGPVTLQCSTTWLPLLHRYNISVIWNVTGTNLNTIQNFRLEWKKVKEGILYFYSYLTTLYPIHNKFVYERNVSRLPFKNFDENPLTIQFELRVRTNNDNIYKSCNLDITPPIPGNVSNITATASTISYLQLGALVINISVQCQQPLVPSTAPENLKYQLGIGFNTPTKEKDLQANITDNRTLRFNIIQSVIVHFPENGPLHNTQQVLIWLRSFYVTTVDSETDATEQATVYSSWSSPVVLKEQQIELPSTTAVNLIDKHFSTSQVGSTSQMQKLATTHQPLSNNQRAVVYISVPTAVFLLLIIMATSSLTIYLICSKRKKKLAKIFNQESEFADQPWLLGRRASSFLLTTSVACSPVDESPCLDDWEVPAWSIGVIDKLGEGEFGEVFKGELCSETANRKMVAYAKKNTYLAVKLLKVHASGSEKRDFLEEIELMKRIAAGNNPHVVNMLGCVTLQEPLSLITEFVEHGDLLTYLCACRKQDELENYEELGAFDESADLISFAYQISSGMEYLASLQVVHRDLACRNVLIGAGKYLKITDFGMSRAVLSDGVYVKTTQARLPLKWMAIESIVNREFTSASDVWSFGVTIWEISTLGNFPYSDILNDDLLNMLSDGHRLEKSERCSMDIYLIMLQCWQADPQDRPLFSELRSAFDDMLCKQKNADELYMELTGDQSRQQTPPPPPSAGVYHEVSDIGLDVAESPEIEPYMRMVGIISEPLRPNQLHHTSTPTNLYVDNPT